MHGADGLILLFRHVVLAVGVQKAEPVTHFVGFLGLVLELADVDVLEPKLLYLLLI